MTRGAAASVLLAHPSAELYGSDRVFLESVSALIAAGKHVNVTLPVTGPLHDELLMRGARVQICTSPVLRKSMLRPRGMLRLVQQTAEGLWQGSRLLRRERPDVVYVNTVTIPLWSVLARLHRIPVICHVHEGEASASRLVRAALTLPLFLAKTIIANSKFSVGVIESSFPRLGARTRIVYNAVLGPDEPQPARALLDGTLRLTYIGRLSPRKGVDVAIDAVALLMERGVVTDLDLVGNVFPGYEWYEAQLHDQVATKQLDGRVRFHGFQPSIWNMISSGDIVVVPSRGDEPFGNTAVEAILGGRPVIASATSGLLEATAGYGSAHTVTPDSPVALADALQRVVAEWSANGRAHQADLEIARSRHSPAAYQKQVAAIVDLVATGR